MGLDAENYATFGEKWTIFFCLGGHRYDMIRNTSYTIEVSPLIILHFPLLAPRKFLDARYSIFDFQTPRK